jgi:hypothetical protein
MDPLAMALMGWVVRNEDARSALPDAPVVPERVHRPARSRRWTAAGLRRLADLLAPEPAAVRPRLASGRESRLIRWDESPCRPSPTTSA